MEFSFFVPLIGLLAMYYAIVIAIVQIKRDRSIANSSWSGGCLIIALYTLIGHGLYLPRQILITSMITLWALRLMIYVYLRYRGEDPRFQSWKQTGLTAFIVNIAYVFGAQALLMSIMSIPTVLINMSSTPTLTMLDYFGIGVWMIGYYFEAVSDYQLFQFTQNPANKGHVMQYGLWHYSRHPNYFGEVTMWWGIFLIALSVPHGLYALLTPISITIQLLFVTGIPWVEKAMEKNPEYQAYKRKTSPFIPWFVQE